MVQADSATNGDADRYSAEALERRFALSSSATHHRQNNQGGDFAEGLPEHIFENFIVVGPTVASVAAGREPEVLYSFPAGQQPAVQELVAFCCPHDSAWEAASLSSEAAWHSYVAAPALAGSESWMFSLRGAAMLRPLYGICVSVIGA